MGWMFNPCKPCCGVTLGPNVGMDLDLNEFATLKQCFVSETVSTGLAGGNLSTINLFKLITGGSLGSCRDVRFRANTHGAALKAWAEAGGRLYLAIVWEACYTSINVNAWTDLANLLTALTVGTSVLLHSTGPTSTLSAIRLPYPLMDGVTAWNYITETNRPTVSLGSTATVVATNQAGLPLVVVEPLGNGWVILNLDGLTPLVTASAAWCKFMRNAYEKPSLV